PRLHRDRRRRHDRRDPRVGSPLHLAGRAEGTPLMGIFRRRETAADDQARTGRLLDGLDAAYTARTGEVCGEEPLDAFEDVVIDAAGAEATGPYPPPGHGYPRR